MNQQEKHHRELIDYIINVTWLHQEHVLKSNSFKKRSAGFRIVRLIFGSLTAGGLVFSLLFGNIYAMTLTTTIMSFITVTMIAFDRAIDYDRLSKNEEIYANRYWELQEEARELLSDVVYETSSVREVNRRFKKLKKIRKQYKHELADGINSKWTKRVATKLEVAKEHISEEDYIKFVPADLILLEELENLESQQ